MAKFSKDGLLDKILESIQDGGWTPLVLEDKHPFLIRVASPGRPSFELRTYIWNCTPGGKTRSADEFRIQFTSVPNIDPGRTTVLLGWHDDLEVFAAWDINAHGGQKSSSPSAQIKLATLEAAHNLAFASQKKDNEIVIAFRPELLVDYALSNDSLHRMRGRRDMALLNDLDNLTDEEIDAVSDEGRRTIIRTIATKYRSAKFRRKVLKAYAHRCAFCKIQLSLLDAAHIIPVNAPGSTDRIVNGIALCKQHHFAYDSNLVSFNERYQIQISASRVAHLTAMDLHGGLREFRAAIPAILVLPQDARHYPDPAYIKTSRKIRGWRP